VPAATGAAADTQPTAAAALSKGAGGSQGSSCKASPYNYACEVNAGDGATLQYTLSDSPQPPENVCTQSAAAPPAVAAAGGQQYLHMLLDAPVQGYVGVGFPRTEGQMSPADAVIGWVDAANGQPVVSPLLFVFLVGESGGRVLGGTAGVMYRCGGGETMPRLSTLPPSPPPHTLNTPAVIQPCCSSCTDVGCARPPPPPAPLFCSPGVCLSPGGLLPHTLAHQQ
jgi:hypothetical protein